LPSGVEPQKRRGVFCPKGQQASETEAVDLANQCTAIQSEWQNPCFTSLNVQASIRP
jgi:hypothetical protein